MRDLYRLTQSYEAGDPWKPQDPNAVAQFSQRFQAVWTRGGHDTDGAHNSKNGAFEIAQAAAIVTYSGGVYAYAVSKNISGSAPTVVATGVLRVTLSITMNAANEWILVATPIAFFDGASTYRSTFGVEDGSGGATKSTTVADVRLFDSTGAEQDCAWLLEAYGLRD